MIELSGKPLFQWAADALREAGCDRVVVVTPPNSLWCLADAVPGGATRQQSVHRGLQALADAPPEAVLVHDAARALTPPAVAARVLAAVRDGHRCVAPVVPLADTVRQVDEHGASAIVDRAQLRAVQTPQGFDYATLRRAHERAAGEGFEATDDVALCEFLGEPVWLIDGDPRAFKITTPFDLDVARGLEQHD